MKHNLKITLVLISLFLITQFIGLYVVGHYLNDANPLPLGFEQPQPETASEYSSLLVSLILSFIFAIAIFFILTKFKIEFILRAWFLIVTTIALSISLMSVFSLFTKYFLVVSLILSGALALTKIYGRNFIIHNFTETLIYPGIAAVFVPILNIYTIIALLVVISIYDMWAVWHSGVMQKMAKYQIDNLKIFTGFFVPFFSDKTRQQIKNWKKTLSKSQLNKKKVKVNVAILGGGDVVFPIITSGVVLKTTSIAIPFGLKNFTGGLIPSIFVIIGALLGLIYLLLFFSEPKKSYPAMPFITVGILLGIIGSYLLF